MSMNSSYKSNTSHMMHPNSKMSMQNEQEKLLHEINMIAFVITEMVLYLDTHPDDKEAIDYFNYYAQLKTALMKEYADKYEPLSLATATDSSKRWEWALQAPPWKGDAR